MFAVSKLGDMLAPHPETVPYPLSIPGWVSMMMYLVQEMSSIVDQEPLDLVKAALLLGRLGQSDVDIPGCISQLDEMGSEVHGRIRGKGTSDLEALNEYLFRELGFRGNTEDYYDPRNSFLHEVLRRKVGIPITLSLVYIEVGKRGGLSLAGVGFPAHFLVRYEGPGEKVYVDAFNGGSLMQGEELGGFLQELTGGRVAMEADFKRPVTDRQLLTRVLYNLKGVYMRSEEFSKLIQVLDLLLLLQPSSAVDHRDRGLVRYEIGEFEEAGKDLRRYLEMEPDAGDREVVESHLREIDSQIRMFR